MTYSTTRLTTRGYDVTLPTAAVQGFLALSHDDQVELAESLNGLEDLGNENPENDAVSDLIEELTQDLEAQDQAIDMFMDDRAQLVAENGNLLDMLTHAARYVSNARILLDQLGITVDSDEDGDPQLRIDIAKFAAMGDQLSSAPLAA